MDPRERATSVWYRVAGLLRRTADLLNTIGRLAIHFPEKFYLEVWRAMTAEISKRELGVPAKPIILARRHYEELPSGVRAALRGTQGPPTGARFRWGVSDQNAFSAAT